MIGNNSCGVHSVMAAFYGPGPRTSDNVAQLEVLTYDGERMRVGPTSDADLARIVSHGGEKGRVYEQLRELRDRYGDLIRERFPDIPRRVSGYNLDELLPEKGFNVARALVGSEGTCVSVLEATVHLIDEPKARSLLLVGYEDVYEAAKHVPEIMAAKPIGCEAIDRRLIHDQIALKLHARELELLPGADSHAWVMVEFGGDSEEEAKDKARALAEELADDKVAPDAVKVFDDRGLEEKLWAVREAGLAATAFPPGQPDHWPGWEDSAVPPERLAAYLPKLRELFDRHGYDAALYGHFGQGCVHCRISFDLRTAYGVRNYRSFLEEAADLVVSFGGSISGEHGDGQQRAELLPKMYGEELIEAFRQFKRIFDPQWKMNPGKLVDPRRLDEDLRLGADYNPAHPTVHFAYRGDGGDFARATLRCVGVGKCRVEGGQVMCPSYQVTREEKHTTRGRARLLHEMLVGEVITDGWRSDEVKESLDLCLACKGCTSDCPVHVDMPTYKAEFLSHYHKRRLRPRHAYAFGLIDQVARLAARLPAAVNFLASTPPLAQAFKWAAGIAQPRAVPRFAEVTLRDWYASRSRPNRGRRKVILWPDTFNNYFHPEVGVAAVEALEDAGYDVEIPEIHLCCGRPLYDFGMLDLAKAYLNKILETLRADIRAGVPLVGIEPSCLAVFRDELPNLLPHDEDAMRLSRQSFHFSEFFERVASDYQPPRLERKALVHGHCHQRATGGIGSELALLEKMGVEADVPAETCCGMAGSFGFAADHYAISMKIGEQALLPAVRGTDAETIVVANGFSCKTQIAQGGTGREALHIAQLMKMAREHGSAGTTAARAERAYVPAPRERQLRRWVVAAATASVASLAAVVFTGARRS
jgi:Fe-S oxidoreductase/FAD/FMN-containing dehydrogenase